MRWFEGSIPAAIATAKQKNFIFVVVITGDDEQSAAMMSSWEDEKVSESSLNSCVAIKVDAKSETCVQFSQIYPVVCIPSSFFIGENGIPLEVIAGSLNAEELTKRIEKVQQMHAQQLSKAETPPSQAESTSSEMAPPAEPAPAPLPAQPLSAAPEPQPSQTEAPPMPTTSKESLSSPAEEEVPVEEESSAATEEASPSSQSNEDLDARVERLTKKLEERREQKKKGEEESEIQKEMERRKLGKEMLDFKRKQEEEKTKRILDERNREKAAEKAARERVKQQIALDRADRAARYARNQEEVESARQAAQQALQAEQEARRETAQRERSLIARIQFRLPDGSSFTNQFPSDSRLQDVHQYAAQEVGNRYGNFSLATMFPRREFTGEDLERSLTELELAPSASIVLLPSSRPSSLVQSTSGGGIWAMLSTIFYPLLFAWRLLSGFLFTSPTPSTGPAPQRPSPASSSGEAPKRESLRKRPVEKRPEDFKKDGKIYRLRTQEDSEDDQNTWNGNSTQQM